MSAQCITICTSLVKLNSSLEEFNSCFVLTLHRKRIPNRHPCARRERIHFNSLICSITEKCRLFHLPKTCRIVFKTIKIMWLKSISFLIKLLSLFILPLIKESLRTFKLYPSSFELLFRKKTEYFVCLRRF